MDAGNILEQASKTFKEKNKEYGENWREVGAVLKVLFPEGLKTESTDDFNRFQFITMIVGKLTRYTNNFDRGHQDSLRDLVVYTAMLESLDFEIANKFTPIKDQVAGRIHREGTPEPVYGELMLPPCHPITPLPKKKKTMEDFISKEYKEECQIRLKDD